MWLQAEIDEVIEFGERPTAGVLSATHAMLVDALRDDELINAVGDRSLSQAVPEYVLRIGADLFCELAGRIFFEGFQGSEDSRGDWSR